MWIYKGNISPIQDKQYDILSNTGCRLLFYNLLVFLKYFVGDA